MGVREEMLTVVCTAKCPRRVDTCPGQLVESQVDACFGGVLYETHHAGFGINLLALFSK